MAKKTQLFLILIIVVLLLAAGLFGYFYWSNRGGKPSSSPEQALTRNNIKKLICEDKQKVFDIADLKNIPDQNFFIGKDLELLRDSYFCQGLLNNNLEIACDKNIYLKEEEASQCQNGLHFSAMILAILRGEKEKAEQICIQKLNGGQLCDYVAEDPFTMITQEDFCIQLPQDQQKMCHVVFTGKEEYCRDLKPERQRECLATADFLKILRADEKNKCNSLASAELEGRGSVVCKLYFDNSQQTCDAIYDKFKEAFCGVD